MRNKLILVLAVCILGLAGCNQESNTTTATPAADQTTVVPQDQATMASDAEQGATNSVPAPATDVSNAPAPQEEASMPIDSSAQVEPAATAPAPVPAPQEEAPVPTDSSAQVEPAATAPAPLAEAPIPAAPMVEAESAPQAPASDENMTTSAESAPDTTIPTTDTTDDSAVSIEQN